MSGRERGKELLANLAQQVRKEVAPSGEPMLHAKGQKALAELAADLSDGDGLPGLKVLRDGSDRVRLQRPQRHGQITIEWQRPIGAMVAIVEKDGRREAEIRYLLVEAEDEWKRMEGEGELYSDVTKWLGDVLYPESKRT